MRASRAASCVLLTLAANAATAAILQQEFIDSQLPADFHPFAISEPGSDGFWALGVSDSLGVLVRYNADGSVRSLHYPSPPDALAQVGQLAHIAMLSDGGALSAAYGPAAPSAVAETCFLRRFDANGAALWTRDIGAHCDGVFVDGSGGIWLFPFGTTDAAVQAVDADGVLSPLQRLTIDDAERAVADPTQAAIYIVGGASVPSIPSDLRGAIWKVDAGGIVWQAAANDVGSVFEDVTVAPDGSVWAFGRHGAQLYGLHAAGDGTVLWSGAFATATNPTGVRVVARADGSVATLHWDQDAFYNHVPGASAELNAFSADGTRLWQAPTGFVFGATDFTFTPALAAAPDGDVFAGLSSAPYHAGATVQQLRLDANGTPRYAPAPQPAASNALQIHFLADSSSLRVDGEFDARSPDGVALGSPAARGITDATAIEDGVIYAADGAAYLLVHNADAHAFDLLAYGADGAARWHAPVVGTWSAGGLAGSTLVLRQSDVCVLAALDATEIVRCFALVDGSATLAQDLGGAGGPYDARTVATVDGANELVVLYTAADYSTHHALIDAGGSVAHDVRVATAELRIAGQNAQGLSWLVFANGTQSELLRVATDGSTHISPPLDVAPYALAPTPDGGVLLFAGGTTPVVEALDSVGRRLWKTPLPNGAPVAGYARFLGGDVYLSTFNTPTQVTVEPAITSGAMLKLALADGSVGWRAPIAYVLGSPPQPVLDPANGELRAFSSWGDRTQSVRFALADGQLRSRAFVPCNVDACTLYTAAVARDGTQRLAHASVAYLSGSAFELTTLSADLDAIFTDGFGD